MYSFRVLESLWQKNIRMKTAKNTLVMLFSLILTINNIAQNFDKPDDTLPVELIYFVGDVIDSAVELRWGTATETNNLGFDIMRKDTSMNWNAIGFVLGSMHSESPKDYFFRDNTINVNGEYFYQLKQIDNTGDFEYSDTVKVNVGFVTSLKENYQTKDINPESFELFQNYPNPFNPETNISFNINERSFVKLKLFSINGEELEVLINGEVIEGTHSVKFNPNSLSSGIYIYKLSVGNNSASKKMLLIK